MLNLTSPELWALIFPSCACTLDTERSHFIRRLPSNTSSFAVVTSLDIAERLAPELAPEHFYIQKIHADNLHYAVIWEATEWIHSDERKMERAQFHIASDAAYISKKIHEYRKELIVSELSKLKLFTPQKSYDLAEMITSKGEEVYKEKAQQFHNAFKGAYENVNLYFPIEQVAQIIDTKNILGYDTATKEETSSKDIPDTGPIEQESQGSIEPTGEGTYQE